MNPIIKYVAIAGILLLGACGSGNVNDANDVLNGGAGFSARTFTVPKNLSNRIAGITYTSGREFNDIAYEYLESIQFKIHKETSFSGYVIRSRYADRLTKDDGIFIIDVIDEIDRLHLTPPMTPAFGVHRFVGILGTTDLGPPLSASATFPAVYVHTLRIGPGGRLRQYDGYSDDGGSIRLEADFDKKTLTGSADTRGSIQHSFKVEGRFRENSNILSGSITVRYKDLNRVFTVPLTGLIGVDGAVGVFSAYENTGDGAGYSLGGGFVAGEIRQSR